MTAMRTMGLAPVLPPAASVDSSADKYVVHLALPGFAREELEVEIVDRLVTVRGDQTQTAVDHKPFLLHERLEETFELPADVDPDHITVAYVHGGLELRASRRPGGPRRPRRLLIEHRLAVNADASGV